MTVRSHVAYVGSPRAIAQQFRPVMKDTLQDGGEYWHGKILPRHFGTGAASRYDYAKRSKFYEIKKRRARGHGRPLEWYGDLKRQVLQRATVSGTAKSARVRIRGPKHLYAYRKDYRQPDKAAELTATNAADRRELARKVLEFATARLERIKTHETVRV